MVAFVALAIGWLYWQGLNYYVDPQTPNDNGGPVAAVQQRLSWS